MPKEIAHTLARTPQGPLRHSVTYILAMSRYAILISFLVADVEIPSTE
jgi:hypothetical protein